MKAAQVVEIPKQLSGRLYNL